MKFILNEATDWRARLTDLNNKFIKAKDVEREDAQQQLQAAWDQYFESPECLGIGGASFANRLGSAFKNECMSLGFNRLINPFISFVQWLYKNKIYVDFKQYGTIHNGYLDGLITASMLRGEDLLSQQGLNVIRSQDFYDKPANTRREYLSLQNNLLRYLQGSATEDQDAAYANVTDILYENSAQKTLRSIEDIKIKMKELNIGSTDKETKQEFKLGNLTDELKDDTSKQKVINAILVGTQPSAQKIAEIRKLLPNERYCSGNMLDSLNYYNNNLSHLNINNSNIVTIINQILNFGKTSA